MRPEKNKIMEELGRSFERKQFEEVVDYFQQKKVVVPEKIISEQDVNVIAMAAFSYFNLNNFKLALYYAERLITYLAVEEFEDDDLLENLLVIHAESSRSLDRTFNAYFFIKGVLKQARVSNNRLAMHYTELKDACSSKALKYLMLIVAVFVFILVFLQLTLSPFSALLYIPVMIILITFLITSLYREDTVINLIKKFF